MNAKLPRILTQPQRTACHLSEGLWKYLLFSLSKFRLVQLPKKARRSKDQSRIPELSWSYSPHLHLRHRGYLQSCCIHFQPTSTKFNQFCRGKHASIPATYQITPSLTSSHSSRHHPPGSSKLSSTRTKASKVTVPPKKLTN